MKVVRIILYILGGLLMAINVLTFLIHPPTPNEPESEFRIQGIELIAFYIGYSFLFLIGVFFLLIGYLIGKNIKRKKERQKARQSIDSLPG